jgi:hypothetical protein
MDSGDDSSLGFSRNFIKLKVAKKYNYLFYLMLMRKGFP